VSTRTTQGILPYQQIKQLIASGAIHADVPIEDRQIQPASLDLRLGAKAYRLLSSFLPERLEVGDPLGEPNFNQVHPRQSKSKKHNRSSGHLH